MVIIAAAFSEVRNNAIQAYRMKKYNMFAISLSLIPIMVELEGTAAKLIQYRQTVLSLRGYSLVQ